MKSFTATTRIILAEQDGDIPEVEHMGSFVFQAEDLESAIKKAKELLPEEDYWNLIGVYENI